MASLDGLEWSETGRLLCSWRSRVWRSSQWPHGSVKRAYEYCNTVPVEFPHERFVHNGQSRRTKTDAPPKPKPQYRITNSFHNNEQRQNRPAQHTLCSPLVPVPVEDLPAPRALPLRASCGRGRHEDRLLIRPRCPLSSPPAPFLRLLSSRPHLHVGCLASNRLYGRFLASSDVPHLNLMNLDESRYQDQHRTTYN